MRKDSTYTLRIDSKVKEALKAAARKDHRTVSSLLEKLIFDYLIKEGYDLPEDGQGPKRRKR